MTDLELILRTIADEPKTVAEISTDTKYSEAAVKASLEFMIIRPLEYNLKTFVSKDGKTYMYQSFTEVRA